MNRKSLIWAESEGENNDISISDNTMVTD
jgi:hypothetical protein